MKATILKFLLVGVIALPLAAQKEPQPKSQKEVDALIAIQNATESDTRIQLGDQFLKDFKNSDFREWANFQIMTAYQEKNDFENMLIYGEKVLEINPDHAFTLVALASAIPLRTKEFDLDKQDKLARAEDYGKRSLTLIPNIPKPNPQVLDEQWLLTKKDLMSQAHEALGMVALTREDYPAAEEALQKALQVASEQSPRIFFYLGRVLKEQGKNEEAIAALDKAIEKGGVPFSDGRDAAKLLKAQIQNEQKRAAEKAAAPPAPPAGEAPPVAPQPEPVPVEPAPENP